MNKKNRWYDQYPELSKYIEQLKDESTEKKDIIFTKIKNLINKYNPDIINQNVMEFPMDIKRRWYDNDPFSWLIINSLKFASPKLLKKVTAILKKNLNSK